MKETASIRGKLPGTHTENHLSSKSDFPKYISLLSAKV
jgi:hypothetical protein